VSRAGLVLLVLFAIVIPSGAFIPADISISSDWAIAGGGSLPITVHIHNMTLGDVAGAAVSLTPVNSTMGTVSPLTTVTDSSGNALFTFFPGTIKGNASLSLNAWYNSSYHIENVTYTQKIDHTVPRYFDQITYNKTAIAGATIPITVRMTDTYGNTVDSKRVQNDYSENVTFRGPLGTDGGFNASLPVIFPYLSNELLVPVDATGNATVQYRVSTRAGDNILQIVGPTTVIAKDTNSYYTWIDIHGIPDVPATILSSISSQNDGHSAYADGIDLFRIYYTVIDQYSNPIPNVQLSLISTKGDHYTYVTNLQGYVYLEYGPSTQVQDILLTASLPAYPGIAPLADTIRFVATGPAIFVVTANPNMIASRDVHSGSFSYIKGELTDTMGRPIAGEAVTFTILSDTANATRTQLSSFAASGQLNTTSTLTDMNGFAVVPLYPGAFSIVTAEGGVVQVIAQWGSVTSPPVTVTYKNYPFLSAKTSVSPTVVAKNDTVNLTIQLIGDGYTPHKPIDVMLCDTRGSTMLQDLYTFQGQTGTTNDKEVCAQTAIWNFTYQFRDTDRLGLVTYGMYGVVDAINGPASSGYPGPDGGGSGSMQAYLTAHYQPYPRNYIDYATLEFPLTSATNALRQAILTDNVTPSKMTLGGGGTNVVPVRYGLYKALKELATNSTSSDTVKGVVLLMDDQYSSWGDPLASGTCKAVYNPANPLTCADFSQGKAGQYCAFADLGGCGDPRQNLATYANSLNTKIYVILLPQKGCQIDTKITSIADALATSTGGLRYSACSATDLGGIYYNIAQKLLVYASINTTMNLAFQNVSWTYNNITQLLPGNQVFDYQFINGKSTNVTSWNQSVNPLPDALTVPPYPGDAIPGPVNGKITYPYSLNQTTDWLDSSLGFYVGNVTIGQTWQANLTFKALKAGFLEIVGNKSQICFTAQPPQPCIPLPPAYVTVLEDLTQNATNQNRLDIIDGSLNATPANSSELLTVGWKTNYTGSDTVTQTLSYQFSKDGTQWPNMWIEAETSTTNRPFGSPYESFTSLMDVRNMVGFVKLKVVAQEILPGGELGVSDVEIRDDPINIGAFYQNYIKLT